MRISRGGLFDYAVNSLVCLPYFDARTDNEYAEK
jgi:hypothetical protein